MIKFFIGVMVCSACGLLAFGCSARKEEASSLPSKGKEGITSASAGGSSMADAKKGDSLTAKVNGVTITQTDVDQAVESLLNRYGGQVSPEQKAAMKPLLGKQALESLINQRLLLQEAEREGIQPDAKALEAQMKEISGHFPSPEAFQKMLASQGISEEMLRHDVGQDLKIQSLLEKKAPKTQSATDAEIAEFYKKNQDEFKTPERVKASHILIAVKPGESDQERSQKKKKIEALQKEIEKGADFAKLASENSDCPSKAQGGDLGYFERGKMTKPFETAAFAMKAGQVSDVVETEFGYHLIKLTGREEAQTVPLEKAKDKVALYLNNEKKQKGIGDYLEKLRKTAKIEYASKE
ncbi:MAG: peptidylprolyl isomerase [Candidatus Aureabacteria bacterium]|nr:peptidylprolyl isomerase [Candidatus Auribacterota bacterium]